MSLTSSCAGVTAKVIYSGGADLDILPQHASKGKGLEFLLGEVCQPPLCIYTSVIPVPLHCTSVQPFLNLYLPVHTPALPILKRRGAVAAFSI